MTYPIICRHSLHLGVMSFKLDLEESTVYRIFDRLGVFLETLFSQLNLKPSEDYLLKKMSNLFVKAGNRMTDMVTDCIKFKFKQATVLI